MSNIILTMPSTNDKEIELSRDAFYSHWLSKFLDIKNIYLLNENKKSTYI